MDMIAKRETAVKIAGAFLGTPYLWGGDNPIEGFDCSGLCIEILKSVGLLPRNGDWRARDLWDKFNANEAASPYAGCLVFWKASASDDSIVHIEFAISDELCIGAAQGGSATESLGDAIAHDAYVMIRPYKSRRNVRGILDPFRV